MCVQKYVQRMTNVKEDPGCCRGCKVGTSGYNLRCETRDLVKSCKSQGTRQELLKNKYGSTLNHTSLETHINSVYVDYDLFNTPRVNNTCNISSRGRNVGLGHRDGVFCCSYLTCFCLYVCTYNVLRILRYWPTSASVHGTTAPTSE